MVRGLHEKRPPYWSPFETLPNSTYTEKLELKSVEAHVLDTTQEIVVIDGFCSICRTMLNNWPDIYARPDEKDAHVRPIESDGLAASPKSSSTDPNLGIWIEYPSGLAHVLPCQETTVRLDSATRKGCRCCTLILQALQGFKIGTSSTFTKSRKEISVLAKVFQKLSTSALGGRRRRHVGNRSRVSRETVDIGFDILADCLQSGRRLL